MMGAALANGLLVPLNNISLGTAVNPALLGGPSATLSGVDDLSNVASTFETQLDSINRMWSAASTPSLLTNTAGDLVELIREVDAFGPDDSLVEYPSGPEGVALKEVARMIKESPAVAHVAINSGSVNNGSRWDTHAGQVASLNSQIEDLAQAIAVFREDVGAHWDRILIVIQTEFGRDIASNNITRSGSQHGYAGAMLLIGGPVANSPHAGDTTTAEWPGLANPFEGRYLDMSADIRTVLREVLVKHMRTTNVDSVFPTFDAAANPERHQDSRATSTPAAPSMTVT